MAAVSGAVPVPVTVTIARSRQRRARVWLGRGRRGRRGLADPHPRSASRRHRRGGPRRRRARPARGGACRGLGDSRRTRGRERCSPRRARGRDGRPRGAGKPWAVSETSTATVPCRRARRSWPSCCSRPRDGARARRAPRDRLPEEVDGGTSATVIPEQLKNEPLQPPTTTEVEPRRLAAAPGAAGAARRLEQEHAPQVEPRSRACRSPPTAAADAPTRSGGPPASGTGRPARPSRVRRDQAASPPVATTGASTPSSPRIAATIPSTWPAKP